MRAIRVILLRLVLGLPLLHATVSRRFLLLTSVDGTPLSPAVPVRYAEHEGQLIGLGSDRAPWWRSLPTEGGAPATARVKGVQTTVQASLAKGEALDQAVLRYLQKYPGEWRALGVDPSAGPDDVEVAARSSAVIVLDPA